MSKDTRILDLTNGSSQSTSIASKLSARLWRRRRPPNAEEASLFAFQRPAPASSLNTSSRESPGMDEDDESRIARDRQQADRSKRKEPKHSDLHHDGCETIVWFPSWAGNHMLATSTKSRQLPDPFRKSNEPAGLHIFVLAKPVRWLPKAQSEAKESFEQQIREQQDAKVGGEAEIIFPSSRSRDVYVFFRNVKQVSKGRRIKLSWKGSWLQHKKIGLFLPESQILLGLRGISTRINLLFLLQSVQVQLSQCVSLQAIQVSAAKRAKPETRHFPKHEIVILAAFESRDIIAFDLPRRIEFCGHSCKLYFRDNDIIQGDLYD